MSACENSEVLIYEDLLPLDLIRAYCRLGDGFGDNNAMDQVLILLRGAAFLEAQKWTGLQFGGNRTISQAFTTPSFSKNNNYSPLAGDPKNYYIQLKLAPRNGMVEIGFGGKTSSFTLPKGSKALAISAEFFCCPECANQDMFYAVYQVDALDCISDTIKLGILKLIAYNLNNPGDEKRESKAAIASGATELWQQSN